MRSARFVVVLLGVVACSSETDSSKRDEPKRPHPGQAMSGKKPLGMRNCPSAVPGAITRVSRTADGVVVTITASDAEAQREIAARGERQVKFGGRRLAPEHSGLHGGP